MSELPPTPPERRSGYKADASLEKSSYFDAHPEEVRAENMNNFFLFLPGADRRMWTLQKSFNKPRTDRDDRDIHSDQWREQSTAQWLQTLDRELSEYGDQELIDLLMQQETLPKRIDEIGEQREKEPDATKRQELLSQQRELQQEFETLPGNIREALVPFYQYLRAKGYTHRDIVG